MKITIFNNRHVDFEFPEPHDVILADSVVTTTNTQVCITTGQIGLDKIKEVLEANAVEHTVEEAQPEEPNGLFKVKIPNVKGFVVQF